MAIYQANVAYILVTLKALLSASLLAPSSRLCIISSIWQKLARQNKLSYTVSKAALQGLVLSAAVEPRARRPSHQRHPARRARHPHDPRQPEAPRRSVPSPPQRHIIVSLHSKTSPRSPAISARRRTRASPASSSPPTSDSRMPASFSVESSTGSYDVIRRRGHTSAEFHESCRRRSTSSPTNSTAPTSYISPKQAVLHRSHRASQVAGSSMPALIEAVASREASIALHHLVVAIGGGILSRTSLRFCKHPIYMRGIPLVVRPHHGSSHGRLLYRRQVLASTSAPTRTSSVPSILTQHRSYIDPSLAGDPAPSDASSPPASSKPPRSPTSAAQKSFAKHLACEPFHHHAHGDALEDTHHQLAARQESTSSRSTSSTKKSVCSSTSATPSATLSKAPATTRSRTASRSASAFSARSPSSVTAASSPPLSPNSNSNSTNSSEPFPTSPPSSKRLSLDDILNRLASDKKHTTTRYTLILINPSWRSRSSNKSPAAPALESALRNAIASTIALFAS